MAFFGRIFGGGQAAAAASGSESSHSSRSRGKFVGVTRGSDGNISAHTENEASSSDEVARSALRRRPFPRRRLAEAAGKFVTFRKESGECNWMKIAGMIILVSATIFAGFTFLCAIGAFPPVLGGPVGMALSFIASAGVGFAGASMIYRA